MPGDQKHDFCKCCNKFLHVDKLTKDRSKKTGYKNICKICDCERSKKRYKKNKKEISAKRKLRRETLGKVFLAQKRQYYQKNKKRILANRKKYIAKNKEKFIEYDKNYRLNNIEKTLWSHAKRRAKRLKIPFDIEVSDIILTEACPVFKTKFVIGESRPEKFSRTLDRIIPEYGYTKNNIVVVSYKANTIKNNASITELKTLLANLYKISCMKNHTWASIVEELSLKTQTIPKYNLHYLKNASKARAKKKNLNWSIDYKDLIIPYFCPLLNIPICNNKKTLSASSITIDRIDNLKGYVPTNIAVVSHKANTIKNNSTIQDLESIIEFYDTILKS